MILGLLHFIPLFTYNSNKKTEGCVPEITKLVDYMTAFFHFFPLFTSNSNIKNHLNPLK